MHTVYIALGSNLGNRLKNIQRAMYLLQQNNITITKESQIVETEPVGGPQQGKFYNAVVEVQTQLNPFDLLETLKSIEKELGRVKTIVNGPRIIDLDILLFDKEQINTEELTIPHPRMLNRSFVINPLREIAPDLVEQLTYAHN